VKELKPLCKIMLVHIAIVITAAAVLWGLPQAIAAPIKMINGGAPGYHPMPHITGSVIAAHNMNAFIKNNQKVSFQQASEIAAKKTANGTVIGGHLGVVQGYLVYVFYIGNIQNKISYLTLVDPGNGDVLYNNILSYLTITDAGAPSHVINIKQWNPLT
jgi:hypothetical protein